jgi:ribosomal protein S8
VLYHNLIADALVLSVGYIGEFEIIDDHRSGKIVIQLNGRLNKTGVISPRFNVQVTQIENWVNLLLPSRGFGIIILVCVVMWFASVLT